VAAGSLGLPDLGITGLDDVLTDVRRITDVCDLPLLVDVDTGFGASAFNVARTVKSMIKFGAAAIHIEDQVGAKRCGHRPNKEIVSQQEMVDRIKAAVDARTDDSFVIMARTDALAVEGLESADRAAACIEAGADMIFPEAITELEMYKLFADRVKAPILANITEFGATPLYTTEQLARRRVAGAVPAVGLPRHEQGGRERLHRDAPRRHAAERDRHHADAHGALRSHRLPHLRAEARCAVCREEKAEPASLLAKTQR
jgi:methylisocitrate lyase